jgi:hypothetical protein
MADIKDFEKILVDRIKLTIDDRFSSKQLKKKANRIGMLLVMQTKQNIRHHSLIDTGRLLNSIDYRIRQDGKSKISVEYGSFAVNYAAVHEFGFHGVVGIPAHSRTRGGNTHNVRAHKRRMNINAVRSDGRKGYIRPSLVQRRKQILNILKEA